MEESHRDTAVTAEPHPSARSRPGRPAVAPAFATALALVAAAAALVVAVLGLVLAGGSAPTAPDRWVQDVVAHWWPDPGEFAYFIDFLGDPRSVFSAAVVLALVCVVLGRRRLAVVALLAPALTGVITTVGKLLVQRTIHGEDNLAYPSGHVGAIATLGAVVMLLAISFFSASRLVNVVVFVVGTTVIASVMAVDQIAIEAHYPLDAVGGLCTALAVVAVVAIAVDRAVAAARRRWLSR